MVQVPPKPASPIPGAGDPAPSDLRPRSGTRQARALATRETIVDAAAHEFASEGYHAAALSKILERSGVTKGAMYFHFASKEAMARAVADVMMARLPEVVAHWDAGHDPLTTAVHVAVGYAALLRDEVACRAGLRVVNDGALGDENARWPADFWEAVHTDLLGRAREAGSLRPGIDPVELARMVVALGTGVRSVCLAGGELAHIQERTAAAWTVLLAGVAEPSWMLTGRPRAGWRRCRAGVPEDGVGAVP